MAVRTAKMTSAELVRRAATGDKGARIFGVSLSNISDLGVVSSLKTQLQHPVNVVDLYIGFGGNFPLKSLEQIAATGAVPEITWEPWDWKLGVDQDTFPLTAIAGGKYDAYIRTWVQAAKAWHGPLLLRFAHEMNGNWYPWCPGVNGNTPAQYVDAYRHVHDLFHEAKNVYWIWSPNVLFPHGASLKSVYPGAAYVNFIGIDGYNFGSAVPFGGWMTPSQVFQPTVDAIEQFAPKVPILITETGSGNEGGSKSDWIHELFEYLASHSNIVGFVWTEYQSKVDWPLQSSKASETAARQQGLAKWRTPTLTLNEPGASS